MKLATAVERMTCDVRMVSISGHLYDSGYARLLLSYREGVEMASDRRCVLLAHVTRKDVRSVPALPQRT
jgi:hypothetical protein